MPQAGCLFNNSNPSAIGQEKSQLFFVKSLSESSVKCISIVMLSVTGYCVMPIAYIRRKSCQAQCSFKWKALKSLVDGQLVAVICTE